MIQPPYCGFPTALQQQLERVCFCSPFAAGLIQRYPEQFERLIASGGLEQSRRPEVPAAGTEDPDQALRIFRNIEMLRIIWRDLNGSAPLEASLADLSLLAESCIGATLARHAGALAEKHGTPLDADGLEQQLLVIAMGKLGGEELNLSSDIDLVFVYPGDGETGGRRKLSHVEYFTRLARAVIGSLSETSEHGFVFRVDTRLRPYGAAGPLVVSAAALERYYQSEGREWERYALVKARAVAGDIEAGTALLHRLRPFVYRRYVDFGAFESLREMAANINLETRRRGWQDDIKRGPGGIREAEFFVQSFQLLRGGRQPQLQTSSFLGAAAAVAELGLVEPGVMQQLISAYRFLRTTENRLQALHDRQTHRLPESASDQAALAEAMHCKSWDAFVEALQQHRASIQSSFDTLVRPAAEPDPDDVGTGLWHILSAANMPLEPLAEAISTEPAEAANLLLSLRRFFGRTALSQRAQQRLDQLMPRLLQQLAQGKLPARPLNHVLDLVRAISRRSAYLVLLDENPLALKRLLNLFARSAWLAEQVIRFPLLLDELIDPALTADLPGRDAMARALRDTLRSGQDDDQQLVALNEYKLGVVLRIAIAELEEQIDARRTQQLLSELAEVLIAQVLTIARRGLAARYPDAAALEMAIIAYGTLGARELGYESDLDLVFLYQPGAVDSGQSQSERFAVRLSQRLLACLSSQTAAGALYPVDTRLRPNGKAGSLVSSLEAFAAYQESASWTWEHQALTRARWIAGSESIRRQFDDIRKQVCRRPREAGTLKKDITGMRQRLRNEKADTASPGARLKQGPGGLVDIEFICQYGVLLCAAESPEVLRSTATVDQLRSLGAAGFINKEDARALELAWLACSSAQHFMALTHQAPPGGLAEHTGQVSALWRQLFDTEQGAT